MMKMTNLACVTVVGAMLCLPSSLSAHGGQYRGPGDTVPPNPGSGGGRSGGPGGPSTPGPGGPTTPGPGGPATPGGSTPTGPTGGGPRTGPTTGGGRGIQVGDDLSQWQFWWEFNKDPFLRLKSAIHAGTVSTGSDDFFMGRGNKSDASDTSRPTTKDLMGSVVPALKKALEDPASNRDIVSSCMIALAKIGGDATVLPMFKKFLPDADQEKRETAALSMGISALPEAVPDLLALATDDQAGRKLTGASNGVDFRTRSFACYGLGLIAYRNKDIALKRKVFEAMKSILDDEGRLRRDVQVAALNAIRLIRPEKLGEEGTKLRDEAVDYLLGFLDRTQVFAQIRAHAFSALATLVGRDDSKGVVKDRIVKSLTSKKKKRQWIYQSAILALGTIATPDDADAIKAIQTYMERGKNQQAKYFCSIALGQIGGEKNRDFLRAKLVKSRTQSIQKPWLALGLAILDYNARKADSNYGVDSSIASDIKRVFDKTKNPIFAAGLGIALGLMLDKENSGDALLERLNRIKKQDEAPGYLAVALGLMKFREAKNDINDLVTEATRRPKLLTQCAISLGLLGDKEIAVRLIDQMKEKNNVAVFSALSQALGFIGDRKSLDPLVDLLGNKQLQNLNRAFSAVALGLVGDKEEFPWNSKISVNINYRANVETLTGSGTGILDIL